MSELLGRWMDVTEIVIWPDAEGDEDGDLYRAVLYWGDKGSETMEAAPEIDVGPVHALTLAAGRTRHDGPDNVRWQVPEGAPVGLYCRSDHTVQLVVGDPEAASPVDVENGGGSGADENPE